MPHYRLYFMDAGSGHIDRAESLHARDNDEAVRAARVRAGRQPMELWEGGRKVHRFEAAANDRYLYRADAPDRHPV